MSRASCAVFYSDSRASGAVFHSDTKARQYSDISVSSKSHICIKSFLYFPSPIGGGDSTVCRASSAVFYSDTRARGAVFHSVEKFRQYIDISISFKSIICIKSKCVFPLPYRYLDSTVSRALRLCVGHPARCFILTQGHVARCFTLTKNSGNILIFLSPLKVLFALNQMCISSPL